MQAPLQGEVRPGLPEPVRAACVHLAPVLRIDLLIPPSRALVNPSTQPCICTEPCPLLLECGHKCPDRCSGGDPKMHCPACTMVVKKRLLCVCEAGVGQCDTIPWGYPQSNGHACEIGQPSISRKVPVSHAPPLFRRHASEPMAGRLPPEDRDGLNARVCEPGSTRHWFFAHVAMDGAESRKSQKKKTIMRRLFCTRPCRTRTRSRFPSPFLCCRTLSHGRAFPPIPPSPLPASVLSCPAPPTQGHTIRAQCSADLAHLQCRQNLQHMYPCGHTATYLCGECPPLRCTAKVTTVSVDWHSMPRRPRTVSSLERA